MSGVSTGIAVEAAINNGLVVTQALGRMRALGERPQPIFDALGAYGEASTRLRFKRGVDPDGVRWKPSARALATGGQTLVNKGAQGGLLGSITYRADDTSAEWGTNKVYGAIHQEGGEITPKAASNLRFRTARGGFVSTKRVVMPKRAFLGINTEDGVEMQAVMLDVVQLHEAGRSGNPGAGRAR